MAQLVPLCGIVMIIAIVVGPVWISAHYKARERAQLHETLRTAYERGLPPPPELIDRLAGDTPAPSLPPGADRDLRRAVILIAVGAGVALLGLGLGYGIGMADPLGGWITGGAIAGSGAIPGLIGVAYLALWLGGRNRRSL
ncbi:MAG: DUF6249 domain-containing protein [Caulobacteraceae bacterium]